MKKILPIGVLVSGRGSNLQAILDAIDKGILSAEVKIVISNNADSQAIVRAKERSIPTEILLDKGFSSRSEYDKNLINALTNNGVELVVLAGFMRIMSKDFIKAFPMKIMNIHPALLPSFPGLNVQKKALEYGVKFSGCTVHFVDEGVDTGPIIIQAAVPIYNDDTEETLSERILKEEHKIYPMAVQLFAEGKLKVEGRRVLVEGCERLSNQVMINPQVTIED
jgi:phosphoribosylglycinamide formyltransferase-1